MVTDQDETDAARQSDDAFEEAVEYVRTPADVPTVFADNCVFMTGLGSTVRLQFVEFIPGARNSTAPGLRVRYTMNVVMSAEGFHHMLEYFNRVGVQVAPKAEAAADGE